MNAKALLLPPLLLLLACLALRPRRSHAACGRGLRLRHKNCSQPGIVCTIQEATANHRSWFTPAPWTPSAPRSLNLSVRVSPGFDGRLTPWLGIGWEVSPDGNINYLEGAELIITHGSKSYHVIFNLSKVPFPSQKNQQGQNWAFSFDQFEVEPSDYVTVTVYHLPRPPAGEDDAHVQDSIRVPDCNNGAMKEAHKCILRGINWDPKLNITLASNRLHVFFNTAPYFDHYTLSVIFNHEDDRNCFKEMETKVIKGAYNTTESSVFIISSLERHCDQVTVQIRPFNACCRSLCKGRRRRFLIDAGRAAPSPLLYGSVGAALALLFVVVSVAAASRAAPRLHRGEKTRTVYRAPPLGSPERQPRQPRHPTLLVLYSLDHPLFGEVILSLASFVRAHCHVEVTLGLWSTMEVARRGPLAWVSAGRQAVGETGGRVLLVCSRGVAAKWRARRAASACPAEGGAPGFAGPRLQEESHAGDHFSAALPLICADLRVPSLLDKYAVAYFDEIGGKEDVPDVFTPAKRYKLTSQLRKMCLMLSNLNNARTSHVHLNDWDSSTSGKALSDSIERFKLYQKRNPKWFEDECLR